MIFTVGFFCVLSVQSDIQSIKILDAKNLPYVLVALSSLLTRKLLLNLKAFGVIVLWKVFL